ncbi:RNA-binding protein 47-like [Ctenocephalides felis]|uniref:RNA-binding protein 47-like n=1 Tax=Ctenocephalides felis TaxID=7515 RepID=UPI000E6E3E19|nr:RNA-binding protein 47-like [Ctenocephalides felis]
MSASENENNNSCLQDINDDDVTTRLINLINKTGCQIIQKNGQRCFGPPPDWTGPEPDRGCEVYFTNIPCTVFEDKLVPIFSQVGKIYELRLMLNFSGYNRGYGFVKFSSEEEADEAILKLNRYPFVGCNGGMKVMRSADNRRLFLGHIPPFVTAPEIFDELAALADGVVEVILPPNDRDPMLNRGYAFVEFESHRKAAIARRSMLPGGVRLWNTCLSIGWAQPEYNVNKKIMSQVKVLYFQNLPLEMTEYDLKKLILPILNNNETFLNRLRKVKCYAFAHFVSREVAQEVLEKLDGIRVAQRIIRIEWAKPDSPRRQVIAAKRLEQKTSKQLTSQSTNIYLNTNGNNTYANDDYLINDMTNLSLENQAITVLDKLNSNHIDKNHHIHQEWQNWNCMELYQFCFKYPESLHTLQKILTTCQSKNLCVPEFRYIYHLDGNRYMYNCMGYFPKYQGLDSYYATGGNCFDLEFTLLQAMQVMLKYLQNNL